MGLQSSSERFIGGKHPIRDNLLLYLDSANIKSYDGTGGTIWTDLSGNTTHPTLKNGLSIDASETKGPMFEFDGVSEHVDTGQKILFASATSNISIEVWFRLDTTNQISGIATQGSGQGSFGIGRKNNGTLSMDVRGISHASAVTTSTIVAGTYYCVVGTYATTPSTKIYLNGEFEAQSTTNPSLTVASLVNTNFKIGHSEEPSDTNKKSTFFDGKIAIIRFYEKALSADEVAYNFSVDRGRFQI